MDTRRKLNIQKENQLTLQILQATMGLIPESVRALSFSWSDEEIVLHFLHDKGRPVDPEDIDDMVFELDALTDGKVKIDCELSDHDDIRKWSGYEKRFVFSRKPKDDY